MTESEYFIESKNGKIFVKEWQPENSVTNQVLVLLHDSLGSTALWRNFPELLATRLSMRVIAYDRHGFGQSGVCHDVPPLSFIEDEAYNLFPEIKAALSLQNYFLLGHSVGGGMAINIAANDKDCQGVISISAQTFVENITIKGIKEAQQTFKNPEQMKKLTKWHGEKSQWVLDAWTQTWLSDKFSNWSLEKSLKQIRQPILVIHGDKDEYGSTAFPKFINQHVKGECQELILSNCGHMPHKERPGDVLTAIASFLEALIFKSHQK